MAGDMPFNGMDINVDDHAVSGIADFLDVLENHRKTCEAEGKYEEAEVARTRLLQLREHEENRRREELRNQQLAERLGVEEAHMKELQEFNEFWDRKVAEFESHASGLQNTLAARHKSEYQLFLEKIRRETEPKTPKWSKDYLNLRKIQETLAKMKKYAEAGKTKAQADQVEEKELAMWKAKREQKMNALEEQFLHKQQLEMGGLLKRIQSGREEQKQARKTELERLLQRYHNVKTQLESQQRIIQQRVEKYPLSPPTSGANVSVTPRPQSSQAGFR
jgi:hypothetical protein|eukprot:TRINITY_DN49455_c0_g1_i1.p1 TRINITY_DN49455_c0_g1~~TRINITY_DN49455_c0_g1_i1.p1  ORF type:complete len:306 (-),score=73.93 TRINITY_DN49455_c0_g1_i1:134-964(-)